MINFGSEILESGTLVVRIGGDLNSESSEYFFNCMVDELEKGNQKVVLNCADLGQVSSVGLAALIRLRSRLAKKGGTVCLAEVESTISDLLHLVNFDKLFEIYSTQEAAIAAIESS